MSRSFAAVLVTLRFVVPLVLISIAMPASSQNALERFRDRLRNALEESDDAGRDQPTESTQQTEQRGTSTADSTGATGDWANFDTGRLLSFTGTVVTCANRPRSTNDFICLNVRSQAGGEVEVIGEIPPMTILMRRGWYAGPLNPGRRETIEMQGYAPRNAERGRSTFIRVARVTYPDGNVLVAFPPPDEVASAEPIGQQAPEKAPQERQASSVAREGEANVFGISLGMTPDQVLAALREHDPSLEELPEATTRPGNGSIFGRGFVRPVTWSTGRSVLPPGAHTCRRLRLDAHVKPNGPLDCDGLEYTHATEQYEETQSVGATFLNGTLISVTFVHARQGNKRFSFDPLAVVEAKYGAFNTPRVGSMTKTIPTTSGAAELRFTERGNPVSQYTLELSLAEATLGPLVQKYVSQSAAKQATISAPTL